VGARATGRLAPPAQQGEHRRCFGTASVINSLQSGSRC
jgi:hypothetical protein